ncbi:MAG: hypothetical protein AABZ06_04030 [Bdellovibrionota bacterium]
MLHAIFLITMILISIPLEAKTVISQKTSGAKSMIKAPPDDSNVQDVLKVFLPILDAFKQKDITKLKKFSTVRNREKAIKLNQDPIAFEEKVLKRWRMTFSNTTMSEVATSDLVVQSNLSHTIYRITRKDGSLPVQFLGQDGLAIEYEACFMKTAYGWTWVDENTHRF